MKNRFVLIFVLLIGFGITGIWAMTVYYNDLPNRLSQHETIVIGQNRFVPGSNAAIRVLVRDTKDASPLENAEIEVALRPAKGGKTTTLFQGMTDADGTAKVSIKVPDEVADPQQVLIIKTKSSLGSDTVEQPVTVDRDYRVLLTTDKPLYQPGQVIHIRVLALSSFDLTPADDQPLEIVIADGKGNKVFRQTVKTSNFGVASADFQLATKVNTGRYKISTTLGNSTSEKTVTVENYVLPKFKVSLETDRSFYQPGDRVTGSLQAGYFFGKPVSNGEVVVEGYTFDVERVVTFELQGMTDETGNFEFSFDLPDYIAGSDLEGGLGRYYLQASVTDQAAHTEVSNTSLPIAGSALLIKAIPEGGQFYPGVENILYILTSYPDGTPAQTDLEIEFYEDGKRLQAETGAYGLAEIRMIPQSPYQGFVIRAQDARGATASQDFSFEGKWSEETVLLRPDRPAYRVGDTMNLTILTSQPQGTVYLDLVRDGQTVSTRSVTVENGRARVAVDLTPDLYGTLEMHAYKILSWGGITRDTRLVVVDKAEGLDLALTPDQETFRPGEQAGLSLSVTGQNGSGAQAAVGLAIVDESVFALAEQDPGFARLYFMLEGELLQPKFDLHGFSIPDLVVNPLDQEGVLDDPVLRTAVEGAAQASLAAVAPQTVGFGIQVNSHQEAEQRVKTRQVSYFANLSRGMFVLLLLILVIVLVLIIAIVKKSGQLGATLGLGFGLIAAFILLLVVWPHPWAQTPLEKLGELLNWLIYRGEEGLLLTLLWVGFLSFLALLGVAWRKKDRMLGWTLGLLPLIALVMGMTVYSASRGDIYPDEKILLGGLMAVSLLPLAFVVLSVSFGIHRQLVAALASGVMGLFMLFGTLPVLSVSVDRFVSKGEGFGDDVVFEELGARRELADFGALPAGAPALELPQALVEKEAGGEGNSQSGAAEPPRLRQFFPETLLWVPDAVTDPDGSLHLEFPAADSITTWRISALASTQDGRLGSATGTLRVFQDFFIDLDLPLALTVGDEVSVPVGVFNYLPEPQTVRLELEQASWFELLDEAEKTIEIAPNDIDVVYFRVKAKDFGRQPFKVTAWGTKMSDAIQKEVRVYPDGKQIYFTFSDRLSTPDPESDQPAEVIRQTVTIPSDAIPGTQDLIVKIYPGIMSQVVEGLDSILRMPFGCFEQTSSTTYPNVLVLDYLNTTNQTAPEVQLKAEEYINLGYQRLTTFEVGGSGGFSLFGDPPPDRMLTAYGLQEFSDMTRVQHVDPALISRASEWLFTQQKSDGSWENDRGLVHENTWASLADDRLPVTAYIAWSLVDSGFAGDPRTQKALAYIRENQASAEDAYVVALVANSLVAADLSDGGDLTSSTRAVLDRLAEMANQAGNGAFWSSGIATFMGSEGQTGSIETTAMAALALLRAQSYPELANGALTYLIQQKDSFGTWYNTQATVLALKALLESVRAGAENVDAKVTVTLNDGQTRSVQVTKENFDVVQLLTFDDVLIGRDNVVAISVEGEGNLMYQVAGSYYLPWDKLELYPELSPADQLVTIDVAYDRTELSVEDTVQVNVNVSLAEGRAEWAMVDLGLPPGFTVETVDLDALVTKYDDVPKDYEFPTIERYEMTGRQLLIYIGNLSADHPLSFSYRLRARFPITAQTPASSAYDYYNPEVSGEASPQTLVVMP